MLTAFIFLGCSVVSGISQGAMGGRVDAAVISMWLCSGPQLPTFILPSTISGTVPSLAESSRHAGTYQACLPSQAELRSVPALTSY